MTARVVNVKVIPVIHGEPADLRGKPVTAVQVTFRRRHYIGPWYPAKIAARSHGSIIATWDEKHAPDWLAPIVTEAAAEFRRMVAVRGGR